jgi:hypothetical protein
VQASPGNMYMKMKYYESIKTEKTCENQENKKANMKIDVPTI